ncbi:monofunctional biosynthetic peptidoglycan transglycosylase [Sphingomonas xanthus]|uniref:Biosynthetic peptidoglycan transglycosylase n=1 Tax=Sphingomonas xanthus TaxID=2594473 RepID=A0A516INZ4_9SPHN|nr:monofunctional biosynthetic peptidoglycan transglycosylase [Sphingomonas xanthus]
MAKSSRATIPTYRRRKKGRGFFGWLVRIFFGAILLSVLWVLLYRFVPPPLTLTMAGDLVSGRGVTKDWMSLDEMDRDMVRAAIAAEDGKFCQHGGFDWDAISDAARRNASGGRIRGGSTISQQTAKNAFLWQGGGYPRKVAEAYFTFLIEKLWGKRRIMEVYLNIAETGIGTYGTNAASERYFGHDASAMSATEAARIAAVLPLPKKRGAITPQGFTRRYGNTINARIGQVRRDGLDACVYRGVAAPRDKTPPPSRQRELPGTDYETATPPPPESSVDDPPMEGTSDDFGAATTPSDAELAPDFGAPSQDTPASQPPPAQAPSSTQPPPSQPPGVS